MSELNDQQMKDLIATQADSSPSDALNSRVLNLANFHATTARHRVAAGKRVQIAVLAGVGGMVAIAAITLAPTVLSARTLDRFTQTMDGAKTMHLIMRRIDSFPSQAVQECWYQNGSWRMSDQTGTTTLWTNGVNYIYNPSSRLVLKQSKPSGPFAHNITGFRVSSLIGDLTDEDHAKNVEISDRTGDSYRLSFDNKGVQERYVFLVDAKTDLPRSLEVQTPKSGTWQKVIEGQFEFNQAYANDLFRPLFPAGVRQIDQNSYALELGKMMPKMAFISNGSAKGGITIRDVEVNSLGHVFIAYNGSYNTARQWLEVTDNQGHRYVRADLYNQGQFRDHELSVPGLGALRVSWWIPEDEDLPFKSRIYTITINQLTDHRNDNIPNPNAVAKALDSTKLLVGTSSITNVPLFITILPSMASAQSNGQIDIAGLPRDDLDLRCGEAYTRAVHFLHRFVRKDGKVIPGFVGDAGPASGFFHSIVDLKKALESAHQEVEVAREIKKHSGEDRSGQGYLDLFEACRLLGYVDDGNRYLEQAKKVMDIDKQANQWLDMEQRLGNLPNGPIL